MHTFWLPDWRSFLPTNYFDDASSINFCLRCPVWIRSPSHVAEIVSAAPPSGYYRLFSLSGRKLLLDYYWSARQEMAENSSLQGLIIMWLGCQNEYSR
jgi:hypothetical protein